MDIYGNVNCEWMGESVMGSFKLSMCRYRLIVCVNDKVNIVR